MIGEKMKIQLIRVQIIETKGHKGDSHSHENLEQIHLE